MYNPIVLLMGLGPRKKTYRCCGYPASKNNVENAEKAPLKPVTQMLEKKEEYFPIDEEEKKSIAALCCNTVDA